MILYFIFFMIVREATGLSFDRRLRLMMQMDADNFDRVFGQECDRFLGLECDRFIHIKAD
ncbi:hypothetical protein [Microcoleus sp. AT3-D2]|uniref:hypothetical protein n=1 Tax=Microcoleus sp. AT3-D2 TaxID=2818612 RepID=UPI002FD49E85